MKRLSTHRFSTDWSLCCICQSSVDSGSLKVEKLADQFLIFWENGLLPFDASLVSDGQVHGKPNFKECMLRNNAVYHHDCYSNFSDYKLHIKLKSKKRKLEKSTENAGPSKSLRSHCENVPSMVMCYICGEEDMLCNLHAAGAKGATKDKLNYSNVEQQTSKYREMATFLGKKALLSRPMIGDLGANSIFDHLNCYVRLVYEYNAAVMKQKNSSDYIDVEAIQASAIDKVVGYICDTESENSGSVFFVDDMEGIYLTYLSEHGIERESHVSRFAPKILQEVPSLETRKSGKRLVFCFSDTINSVLTKHLSDHGGFISKVRKFVTPIRQDMSRRKNQFSGCVEDGDQKKSISILLLTLINMLVDGHADIENDCSQATLSIAQCITFNMRKKEGSQHFDIVPSSWKSEGNPFCSVHQFENLCNGWIINSY